MAVKYGVGCKDIKAGPIGANGTMGTVLTSVGKLYKDTVNLLEEDGTITRHFAENARYPFLAVFDAGGLPLKFTLIDISAANLGKWLGGTVNLEDWSSPVESFSQELSVELITVYGTTVRLARCMFYGKITWNASRTEIAKVDITGEVLEPEDAATPPVKTIPTPA